VLLYGTIEYNIFGILFYVVLASAANLGGKGKYKIHWLMWVLAILIIARYAFIGSEGG
jgi:AGZA family xanthine/uracil permease-like MFS transporter